MTRYFFFDSFHYFAIRKMHFLLRARAIVAFPGGFGTIDEVFEALTLVQTGKIEPLPLIDRRRGEYHLSHRALIVRDRDP